MGHIELVVAARGRVHDDHDGHTLVVLVRDKARTLVGVSRVELDQVSALANLALDFVP